VAHGSELLGVEARCVCLMLALGCVSLSVIRNASPCPLRRGWAWGRASGVGFFTLGATQGQTGQWLPGETHEPKAIVQIYLLHCCSCQAEVSYGLKPVVWWWRAAGVMAVSHQRVDCTSCRVILAVALHQIPSAGSSAGSAQGMCCSATAMTQCWSPLAKAHLLQCNSPN